MALVAVFQFCPWQRWKCVLQKTISIHARLSAPSSNELHSHKKVLHSFLASDQHPEGKGVFAMELTSLFAETFVKYSPFHLSSWASLPKYQCYHFIRRLKNQYTQEEVSFLMEDKEK